LILIALVALPSLRSTHAGVVATIMLWGIAYGAIPLCLSIWMQLVSPDRPEAGSSMFVTTVQLAIASGSFAGGMAVDRFGIPAAMVLGAALAAAGLLAIASFNTRGGSLREILSR
jgi:predicted MFS family arabinose efflux permease